MPSNTWDNREIFWALYVPNRRGTNYLDVRKEGLSWGGVLTLGLEI